MSKSENLYNAARELIPGGVNSPVRAFTGVGGTPLFIERADGAYLYDVDGKAYIDYSAPGAQWCWVITIRPSAMRSLNRRTRPELARRRRWKLKWRRWSPSWSRPWIWSAW